MNLESERLYIKEINWKDLENIFMLQTNPAVNKYSTFEIPDTINDTEKMIKPCIDDQKSIIRKQFCWALISKSEKSFLGLTGLNLSVDRFKSGEIYYELLPAFWEMGYATEAVKKVISFGFASLNLHRIEADVAIENQRSVKVLEKAGMIREGTGRKILPIHDCWKDSFFYAVIENDIRDYQ